LQKLEYQSQSFEDSSFTHSFVPLHESFWEIVLLGIVEDVLDELWEDRFELFESSSFCHVVYSGMRQLEKTVDEILWKERKGSWNSNSGEGEGWQNWKSLTSTSPLHYYILATYQ